MKHLYFCRHGLSIYGKETKWAGGRTDSPLAAEGRQQAAFAGQYAQKLHLDHIVTSPLSRALDTAKIIAEAIGYPSERIIVDGRVIERHFGELEGTPYDPTRTDLSQVAGVEPLADLLERAKQVLAFLETIESNNILVVSHGSFGRALAHVINPSIAFEKQPRFENAKIVKLI